MLISESGMAQEAYMSELYRLGVEVDCISSPEQLQERLCDIPYNGLLVDVPTMIRSDSSEKSRVTRIMDRFPVLRLLFNSDQGSIRGLSHGGTVRDNKTLESFVLNDCLTFPARSIRRAQRSELVLNVMLAEDCEKLGLEQERTVTVNVSEQGCFVYSTRSWEEDESAWIVVRELEDKTPIGLHIHWTRSWGQTLRMPGIGTSFSTIRPDQLDQIRALL